MNDEGGDRLRQLCTPFHDPEAERYDFGLKKEVNHLGVIYFYEGSNNSQGCQPKILKGAAFRNSVQEWIQEKWNMSLQEKLSRVLMRCHALQKRQDVTGLVRNLLIKERRAKQWIYADDFLKKRCDGAN